MLLIENIGCLATMVPNSDSVIGEISDAAILIDGEKINWCGKKQEIPKVPIEHRINADDNLVIPGLIDCHSHLVFAGSRADEFAKRMGNESYLSIMSKGGGIVRTVLATNALSDEELYSLINDRAHQILQLGVTTIEAKSGYGLNVKDELRALRLLQRLNQQHMLDIHNTFLGAHVVPSEYLDNPAKYCSLIINEMLPQIATEKLAIDCDVFCEAKAFSVDQAYEILLKAHDLGLGLRAHVQQLSHSGGVRLVAGLPIKSISHADYLSDADVKILKKAKTVVEVLPFATLFLRSKEKTPARTLMNEGIDLAIATDFNPGSAMCHDLILAARLGVTYFHFSLNEALKAITVVAAKSLGRDDIGIVKEKSLADLVITNCKDINEFFYDWTKQPGKIIIKRGKIYSG